MDKINKKGFTIIELLITIAVLSILVLIGTPRLLGHTEKAQLTRIQHDVKVMENKMAEVLNTNSQELNSFQNNGKDLGRVILRKELFEEEGLAGNVSWDHLSAKWMYANRNSSVHNEDLGMGGDLIQIDDKYSTYKIIPKEYSHKINTRLKGTFYVNSLGKVYYEHNNPLNKVDGKESLACVAPETLGYEFEVVNELGTITGWTGDATHLVIPASFKMSNGREEWCEPVRIIGKGAFQNHNFKKVSIPQSVETIEDEAFQGGQLIEIEVPHSVVTVGNNAFSGNQATSSGGSNSKIVVKGSESGRNISNSAFGGFSFTYAPVTDKDLGVSVRTTNSNGVKTASIVGRTSSSGSSSLGGNSSSSEDYYNTVITIPKEIKVNGELLPITEVEKGAFQGSGLVDVIMPEGLLYIHDYAFAGNQLIRAVIPNSVIEIGNYAFAYNEINDKPTINPINILENKFTGNFSNVDDNGNINQSVNSLDLKDHIFIISSMGKHTVEDVGTNLEESKEDSSDDSEEQSGLINPVKSRKPEGNEITVYSAEDLAKIGVNEASPLNGNYILMNDIDLSSTGENWTPIGNGTNRFKGQFDGNGYKISNLKINMSQRYVGLFGHVEEATIKNVALLNVDVIGGQWVGGIVGYARSSSIIENSYATGSVEGTGNHVGGLVGTAFASIKIRNSYATGNVTGRGGYVGGLVGSAGESITITDSYATGRVSGTGDYVGGLAGRAADSSTGITNSYATGSVTGNHYVGGFVGQFSSSARITNSYSTGSVTGANYVGGLVGRISDGSAIVNSYAIGGVNGTDAGDRVGGLVGQSFRTSASHSSSTITRSYWNTETTGQPSSASSNNRFGKTTNEMKQRITYSDWDFDAIWAIDEGQSYPYLRSNPQ